MQARRLRKAAIFAVALGMAAMGGGLSAQYRGTDDSRTRTPIKHVVVIFQENVSFDHYFGTYPHAANLPGDTVFRPQDDTPRTDNLLSAGLLELNPNGVNPFRIAPKYAVTCDEDHNYNDEQFAFHAGLMDRFTATLPSGSPFSCKDANLGPSSVMGYYDGNTTTALWNYAQYFAMSDNSFGTTFGPSTPGVLNLVAGQNHGATVTAGSAAGNVSAGLGVVGTRPH